MSLFDQNADRLVDATAQVHRTAADFQCLDAFLDQRVGQNDRSCRAVAGDLVGLHRHLAHNLRTHVLEPVEQLDFRCDADPVTRNERGSDRPVDHGVHALGAEGRLDRGRQFTNTNGQRAARIGIVQ